MSQSDYIKYLRVSTQLLLDSSKNQLPVFTSKDYLEYKEYVLENTIKNTKIINNLLTPSGEQIIFGIERKTNDCPSMNFCKNTNLRLNRKPLSNVYFTPTPQPLNWKDKKNASWKKNGCICSLNSMNTIKYVCNCKTTF
jgi:hypothetical protein